MLQQLGNAAKRVDPAATAFGHRHADWELVIAADWTDPGRRRGERPLGPGAARRCRAVRLGDYVNSLIEDDMPCSPPMSPTPSSA